MKRLKINVDGWFAHFKRLPADDGYLPQKNITGMVIDESGKFDFEPSHTNLGDQNDINLLGHSRVSHHFLNSIAICFWKGATCLSCTETYAVHSMIAKTTLASCDVEIKSAVYLPSEKVLFLKPLINIDAHDTGFCVLTFGTENLDKMLANTWQRLIHEVTANGLIDGEIAKVSHTHSQAYGGKYWALHCPHCAAIQGENFVKPTIGETGETTSFGAMGNPPDLIVIPMLNGQPT